MKDSFTDFPLKGNHTNYHEALEANGFTFVGFHHVASRNHISISPMKIFRWKTGRYYALIAGENADGPISYAPLKRLHADQIDFDDYYLDPDYLKL